MDYNRTYATALRGGKRLYKAEQEWFRVQARRELQAGYAILGGLAYLVAIICVVGIFMWLVPLLCGMTQ